MDRPEFVYGADSAGVLVLGPTLEPIRDTDYPGKFPYGRELLTDGLGLIDRIILPHFESADHGEDVEKEVEYCKRNGIPYQTVRDGEVIIIDQQD